MMSEARFTNELGNSIRLKVQALPVSGVAGVLIELEGPHSLSENFITLQEAQELYAALGAILLKHSAL